MAKTTTRGGSFAPPLSDDLLAEYAQMAADQTGPVGDALRQLLACVSKWWKLPESKGDGTPHPSGRGIAIALDHKIAAALDDHIPWKHELDAVQQLFDAIPASNRDLRRAAFHVLWHVKELDNGREPITTDKL